MNIIPAPCLICSSQISISEAIEKMQEAKTSYVLLTDEKEEVSGIFTDRDILQKFQMLLKDDQLSHPVHTVMSRPIKSLPIKLIHTTPEYMRSQDIRHVPIVVSDDKDKSIQKVVGIITAQQIFNAYVEAKGMPLLYKGPRHREKHRIVGVLSPDGTVHQLMMKLSEDSPYLGTQRYLFSDLQREANSKNAAKDCDAIVIDIDNARENLWAPVLKFFIENPNIENVCITYTKEKNPKLVDFMKSLNNKGLLEVYEKPIDIGQLVLDLEKEWSKN